MGGIIVLFIKTAWYLGTSSMLQNYFKRVPGDLQYVIDGLLVFTAVVVSFQFLQE